MRKLFCFILLNILFGKAVFCQIKDSIQTSPQPYATQKFSSYIAPAVLLSYGTISLLGSNFIRDLDFSTHFELKEDHPNFNVKLDNYMRYAPLVAVYGLDLIGIKAKHSFADRSASLLLSAAIMVTTVSTLKGITNRLRPNGTNNHSYPSGHTATAFMLAEFLNQEYKDRSVWFGIAGYSLAAGTGVFRMYNKAHWISDVVAGAGFGMLATKLAYLAYPKIKKLVLPNSTTNFTLTPSYQQGTAGFSLSYQIGK
ncbi:MAG TPA: phosphatase PAP2 family protein [Pelobium sp.]